MYPVRSRIQSGNGVPVPYLFRSISDTRQELLHRCFLTHRALMQVSEYWQHPWHLHPFRHQPACEFHQ